MIVGLRPANDEELQGLDYVDHGEAGYHYEEG
jgi:ammonia channel protein AmtB